MSIKIHINLNDQEFAATQAKSLRRWIEDEAIDDVKVNLEKKELKEDKAGAGIAEGILAVTLGAPAIVALVKSIHVV